MPVTEVGGLDWLDYMQLRRDVFIYEMGKSEEGVAYLNDAWRLEQTSDDREKARRMFG